MKQGLIVYLVGDTPVPEGLDPKQTSRALGSPADRLEVVGRDAGFFTVEDAWHFLLTQGGCGRVNLVVAQVGAEGDLKALKPPVRLYG
uniref:Uncharacterized protein n=1 Tax=Desulfobacca acetoxidans TaxID=60893 RepID=A0A7V4G8Y2_9BACT